MPRRRKRYKEYQLLLWVTAIAGLLLFAYAMYLVLKSQEEDFVEYRAFGIPIPPNYQIHGIDVSRYQDRISWEAVSGMTDQNVRIGFAMIKATEGVELRDPFFKRNWDKAKEAGLVRGAYHFFRPSANVQAQIRNFQKTVKLEPGDLPPVLDVEDAYKMKPKQLQKLVKTWLDAIEAAYGVKPIIYTYLNFYETYLNGSFDDYPLWVAHYFQPNEPRIKRDWTFWQHNDGGRVNGILSKVDFNVFNGDSTAFQAMLVP